MSELTVVVKAYYGPQKTETTFKTKSISTQVLFTGYTFDVLPRDVTYMEIGVEIKSVCNFLDVSQSFQNCSKRSELDKGPGVIYYKYVKEENDLFDDNTLYVNNNIAFAMVRTVNESYWDMFFNVDKITKSMITVHTDKGVYVAHLMTSSLFPDDITKFTELEDKIHEDKRFQYINVGVRCTQEEFDELSSYVKWSSVMFKREIPAATIHYAQSEYNPKEEGISNSTAYKITYKIIYSWFTHALMKCKDDSDHTPGQLVKSTNQKECIVNVMFYRVEKMCTFKSVIHVLYKYGVTNVDVYTNAFPYEINHEYDWKFRKIDSKVQAVNSLQFWVGDNPLKEVKISENTMILEVVNLLIANRVD